MRTISLFKLIINFILKLAPVKNTVDKEYKKLLKHILKHGKVKNDRTGTGTISVFGGQIRIPLSEGFPLLTTKFVSLKMIAIELLWFISGETNIRPLVLQGCNIWNKDAYRGYKEKIKEKAFDGKIPLNHIVLTYDEYVEKIKNDEKFAEEFGELGETYGHQWRKRKVDQLKTTIESIKKNPDSRRHVVDSWDSDTVNKLTLPPCHPFFQFYVQDNKLSCHFVMRSSDTFLGLSYNIASYALLLMMVAHECGLELGDLIFSGGDIHLYLNHVEQAKEQIKRRPYTLPTVTLNPEVKSVFDFKLEDITLHNYKHHPAIKGEMST